MTGPSHHDTPPIQNGSLPQAKPQRSSAEMTQGLSLHPQNEGVFAVRDAQGQHVGNLKRTGPVWKFKAVGYTAWGAVEPGGGPLTHRHNAVFERPDAADVSAGLLTE